MVCIRRAVVLRFAFPLLILVPSIAAAQPVQRPVGPFVADVRGIFANYKSQPAVADELGVASANVPSKSLGLSGGVHWYPLHLKNVTFGFGGEFLMSGSSRTVDPTSPTDPSSPVVRRHFSALSSQLSINFGHRNGWSYISGGIGRSKLYLEREDDPVSGAPGRQTLNYGAGARWFIKHHLAFSAEIRWYAVSPQESTPSGPVSEPHTTLMVLSAGIGLR